MSVQTAGGHGKKLPFSQIQYPSKAYPLGACGKRGSVATLNLTVDQIPKTRAITRKLIRDLWIPRKDPPELTAYVTRDRLDRLVEDAKIVTAEEKEEAKKKIDIEREKLREKSEARRTKMKEIDLNKKPQLSEFEREDIEIAKGLRAKANVERLERDEQIKELNELILHAKIKTIRDDQVAEKHVVKQQFKKAEGELDRMMEKDRVEGLQKEEEKQEKRKKEAYAAGSLLREQIDTNLEYRLLEKDRKYKEGTKLQKRYSKYIVEDLEEFKKHKLKQKELLKVLLDQKDEEANLRKLKKLQSKELDIMISAYQRLKGEKEEAAEAAEKESKRLKEIETRRLGEMQERARDEQADKDALRARRAQEEKERQFRKAEKEAALNRLKVQQDLQQFQVDYWKEVNSICLLKAQREQQEYKALVDKNKQELDNEDFLRMKRKFVDMRHGQEVLKQIKEKETEKINERKEVFRQGIHAKQEAKITQQRLDAYLTKKMNEMEKYDIPKECFAHIHRKLAK